MSKASIQAYEEIKPKRVSIETRIYKYLRNSGGQKLSNILEDLQLKHQTATSRLSSLHDAGLVVINQNGEYRATYEWEVNSTIEQRARDKKSKWLKKGHENGWIVNGMVVNES